MQQFQIKHESKVSDVKYRRTPSTNNPEPRPFDSKLLKKQRVETKVKT